MHVQTAISNVVQTVNFRIIQYLTDSYGHKRVVCVNIYEINNVS